MKTAKKPKSANRKLFDALNTPGRAVLTPARQRKSRKFVATETLTVKAPRASKRAKWKLVQGPTEVVFSGPKRGLKSAAEAFSHAADIWQRKAIVQGITALCSVAYDIAERRGWHHNPVTGRRNKLDVPKAIALQHSELSEALEAHRTDAMDDKLPTRKGLEVELADAVIRICHLAAWAKLDLAGAIVEKNRFNETRKDHKRGARAGKGGKRY